MRKYQKYVLGNLYNFLHEEIVLNFEQEIIFKTDNLTKDFDL